MQVLLIAVFVVFNLASSAFAQSRMPLAQLAAYNKPDREKVLCPLKEYGFKRWYPEQGLTTEQYEKLDERWTKELRALMRR